MSQRTVQSRHRRAWRASSRRVDLRAHNIAQAEFVADRYGIDNARFQVRDADEIVNDETWDVVFNLGLLYHVLNPFHLIKQTYELCRSFAVIDTVCHTEPCPLSSSW